jgi:hypothetical protein
MNRGLKRREYADHRRYDFHRTFKKHVEAALGAVGGQIPDFELPLYSNPNQNEPDPYWPRPALPNGCTGFAQAHVAEADLGQPVNPYVLYKDTLVISGGKDGDPATLEQSFRAGTVYGVKVKDEADTTVPAHRLAPYFEVKPKPGQDSFDAILEAVYANQHPVSVGTTWPSGFENVGPDGLQTVIATVWIGGHDHCFIGKKTIGGVERLIDLSWNGENWGDRGRSYFTREQVNAMMKIPGSDALTSRVLSGEQVKTVWVSMLLQGELLQLLVSLYQRLIASSLMALNTPQEAQNAPTSPVPAPAAPSEPDFSTPQAAFHSARVICDDVGLSYDQKNILCACLYQESRFMNRHSDGTPVINQNKDPKTGAVWSTDYGIGQVNDYYHIGQGKDFPTVDYVMDHPEAVVRWMAEIMKTTGKLAAWSSYASGAYKQWLDPRSPMWALKG